MWHLTSSELRRFRSLILIFGIAHLVGLRLLATFADPFVPSRALMAVGVLFYGLCGLIFGRVQFGPYQRPNQWAYLIHRPLAPGRIFAALTLAGAIAIAAAVALPWVVNTLAMILGSPAGVDPRHWLLMPFIVGLVVAYYLCGVFILLSKSRVALFVVCWPAFFLTSSAVGGWVFLVMAVVLLWLAYITYAAFKPDLTSHVRKPLALAATALPIQYAFLGLLLFAGNFIYSMTIVTKEVGLGGLPTWSWNEYFGEGSTPWVRTLPEGEAMLHALSAGDSPAARFLERQIALADAHWVSPTLARRPLRHQLFFQGDGPPLIDSEGEVRWVFRHDAMRFEGTEIRSGEAAGWLGKGASQEAFDTVPLVRGSYVAAGPELLRLDPETGEFTTLWRAPAGERLVSAPTGGTSLAVLSDRALYLFTPRPRDETLVARAAVPLPTELRNLFGVHFAELVDGWAVAFLSGRLSDYGFASTEQVIGEVSFDGEWSPVAERPLRVGLHASSRYLGFILSPALRSFHYLAWSAAAPRSANRITASDLLRRRLPSAVYLAALGVALLSAASVAWLARRRRLTMRERWGWIAAGFLTGVPGLLSFVFLTSRREDLVPVRRSPPSAALPEGAVA
ncbi:MAG: hypothetical protein AAF481_10965 [Acidobacteriota bacterium]